MAWTEQSLTFSGNLGKKFLIGMDCLVRAADMNTATSDELLYPDRLRLAKSADLDGCMGQD